jgi:hypothetical protein
LQTDAPHVRAVPRSAGDPARSRAPRDGPAFVGAIAERRAAIQRKRCGKAQRKHDEKGPLVTTLDDDQDDREERDEDLEVPEAAPRDDEYEGTIAPEPETLPEQADIEAPEQ